MLSPSADYNSEGRRRRVSNPVTFKNEQRCAGFSVFSLISPSWPGTFKQF